nr:TPM domain-containing protein [Flavobacteriales bacterium]
MRTGLIALLLLLAWPAQAARFDCTLEPPKERDQNSLVWDYADWLEHGEADRLNAKLVAFARETSNQLLVIIVDT